MVPSGNKPLPEPMLTQISCHHMASLGPNELSAKKDYVDFFILWSYVSGSNSSTMYMFVVGQWDKRRPWPQLHGDGSQEWGSSLHDLHGAGLLYWQWARSSQVTDRDTDICLLYVAENISSSILWSSLSSSPSSTSYLIEIKLPELYSKYVASSIGSNIAMTLTVRPSVHPEVSAHFLSNHSSHWLHTWSFFFLSQPGKRAMRMPPTSIWRPSSLQKASPVMSMMPPWIPQSTCWRPNWQRCGRMGATGWRPTPAMQVW